MFARRTVQPKPRKATPHKFVAPVAGWVANRALTEPGSIEGPAAQILDNFFPRSTSVSLRRGQQRYATLDPSEEPVTAVFSYRNGLNERLFAANMTTIFDVTEVTSPYDVDLSDGGENLIAANDEDWIGWSSTLGHEVAGGFTGGEWITAQFATTGGVYLIGVNGTDVGFIYDGSDFYPYISGGISRLYYDGETDEFSDGDTVTGSTSGATAVIWRAVHIDDDRGYLLLKDIDGTFQDNEPLTDTGGGAAVADGIPELIIPGIDFAPNLTTADMSFVWVYKNRLFFAEKNSMNAWYAKDPDAIGGEFDIFPLSGVFSMGGSLLFGSPWSMSTSGGGGLSEQCVFVSSEGEAAIYQGTDPSSAQNWSQVGLYRIGKPLGKRAFMRGGGDLAIATTVGLVPLSKAIELDVTALNVATVSYKIADAWQEAVEQRGDDGWVCEIWAEGKMAVVSPPDPVGLNNPVVFVSNTETGAWCRFTGWHATCMVSFKGKLYFGSDEGAVFIANASGSDDGDTYTGICLPLFDDLGASGAAKIAKVARARSKSSERVAEKLTVLADFKENIPAAPDASTPTSTNVWGTAVWGEATWGSPSPSIINQDWQSVGGIGYSLSVCYQVSSGSPVPLDVDLLSLELMYTTAEWVS